MKRKPSVPHSGGSLIPPPCEPAEAALPLVYPPARRAETTELLHGVPVADPYRWLEDLDSAETREWIEAQNRLTFSYLRTIPERDRIKERLTRLWNYERWGVPWSRAGRLFFTRNDGLQNQDVLYTVDPSAGGPAGEPRVLLDPNLFSEDGTVSIQEYAVSEDGGLLAYAVSQAGSDWSEIRVREIANGSDRQDRVRWVKFSRTAWDHEGRGFFYSRYDEPRDPDRLEATNYHQKLYYHRLGTAQSEDLLVYARPDRKEWGFGGEITEDGRFLVIHVWRGTEPRNLVFYRDCAGTGPVVELIREFEAEFTFVGNDGPVLWFKTDLHAPRGRLLAIDLRWPERSRWREILPQRRETLLEVHAVGGCFVAHYLRDARSLLEIYDRQGGLLREVGLPGIGTVAGLRGRDRDAECWFAFTGFTMPPRIYRLDPASGRSVLFRRPRTDFDPDDYETRQVFYTSRDGTRVPMFLTHRRDLPIDGQRPTYLYGYGGFGSSLTPAFSVGALAWMELGGVYAVANLRGGGEYGEEWHQAGTLARKQNVFDDFSAAAEWLCASGYTSRRKLAIGGGSNGGLLVGACLTQHPELFGAAAPSVGVLDMLRFHRFTIGWAWVSDYGSPEDPELFPVLRAYSPLHNIRPGIAYPPTFITTADHDDRVVPSHSFKFAATLQAAQAGPAPILIRVETRAGHGIGKPTAKWIEEIADRWAFLRHGMSAGDPSP